MMDILANIAIFIAGAFLVDWLVCGKFAAIWSKFNYRYRLTARRAAALAMLAGLFGYVIMFHPVEDYRTMLLVGAGILAFIYFVVACLDVTQQNLPEVPPRYGENE